MPRPARRLPRARAAGLLLFKRYPVPAILIVAEVGGEASIPKGRLERRETSWQAALRETYEEVGVQVHPERLGYRGRMAAVDFWTVEVLPRELPGVLPRAQLQLAEVRWAGFVPVHEALHELPRWQSSGIAEALVAVGML